jgi:hypothetical protein
MASSFRAGVEGAAPLLAQLETDAYVSIYGLDACGANATGSTSRPTLYRPASIGLWGGFHLIPPTQINGLRPSDTAFITVFNTPPSIPSIPTSSVKVPFQVLWRVPPEQGVIILPGDVAVLYANTSGGHAWNASVIWEEN